MWLIPTKRAACARRQRGFTLIEVLLAMVVFAMLGTATAAIMQQVIQSDEISQQSQRRLKDLQLTMNMLERDLGQMIPRASRDAFGELGDALFEHGANLYNSDGEGIRFTRLGWLNPQGRLPRGSVQQVIYRVQDEKLQRLYTLYPDPVEGEEPIELDMMDGVLDLKFAFYLESSWERQVDGTVFPNAVAVELELADLGVIRRHIMLPAGYEEGATAEDEDESENGGSNTGGGSTGSGSNGAGGNR
ncbi:type II secretion system minor pseudopilin GspJ [Ferrimonas pelagia]|uniref:Type II secretion system protein J n=1 Tax=Ferrimonas pelagia TaxID=1177826 RepID=A0ABP9EZY6_9GAMM